MASERQDRRVRVAAVNDYELVVDGVAKMLSAFDDRLHVCETIVIGEQIEHAPIDVALYDTYGRSGILGPALVELLQSRDVSHVAMFTMDLRPELVENAQRVGVRAFISKMLPRREIVAAIEATARGERVFACPTDRTAVEDPGLDALNWPGEKRGLSERESEVLVLVAEGLTNAQIADALYLSLETVKSHISTIFPKLEVHNRVQAANFVSSEGAFSRYRPANPADSDSCASPG